VAWACCYAPDFRASSTVGAAGGTTATNDRRLVNNVSGTQTFIADVIDTGRYVMRCDSSAGANRIGLASVTSTAQYCGGLCRFRVNNATFANNVLLAGIAAVTSTNSVWLRANASTGELAYTFGGSAGTFTNSGVTINPQQTYRLEMFVDFGASTTTHTLKVRLDAVEVINVTGGTAIDTVATTGSYFGSDVASTSMTVDYSDMVAYNDVAQYGTIADWRVIGLEPLSDGAHSMTANDFQDDAAANLSNSTTTSWSKVDDAPSASPTVTDFVQQVVTRTTSYMEWVLRSMPSGYDAPLLVDLVAAMHPVAAATANSVAFRLNSNGNVSAEAAIDTSIASNTLEYRHHFYTTEPGGAAWTLAKAQVPLRARFGFSGDAAPPPALDAIMAFVFAPVLGPTPHATRVLQAVNRAATY
jgi:hypothetical protein